MKRKIALSLFMAICILTSVAAADTIPYEGIPKNLRIELKDLDDSPDLIYCGVDIAVFADPDKDGIYTVKENKVKRTLTTSTILALDLGSSKEYQKDVLHKIAIRILYVAVGTDQHDFIIADYNNNKEGWQELPIIFRPTYFGPGQETSYVQHTEKWEENRVKYNATKKVNGLNTVRSVATFWSGERFNLEVETTELVSAVQVEILDTEYHDTLALSSATTEGGIYTGSIWDSKMLNLWGNYSPKQLAFRFKVTGEDGTIETKDIQITMDNREPYYRIRQEY